MRTLRDELDLRRKTEIHEIEERKNGQINELMKTHEKAFTDIKNYYNDITLNNLSLINTLKVCNFVSLHWTLRNSWHFFSTSDDYVFLKQELFCLHDLSSPKVLHAWIFFSFSSKNVWSKKKKVYSVYSFWHIGEISRVISFTGTSWRI